MRNIIISCLITPVIVLEDTLEAIIKLAKAIKKKL